uniref:NADP-dependent oxidoreductase n=1 Tax=Streptomyces sp. NBC_00003 TaxID=2903608 RepID=A0AAU2UZD7_9ACTN
MIDSTQHTISREVRLAARPHGPLGDEHFEIVERPVPEPEHGQVLVRNKVMGIAAVMRTLMDESSDVPMRPYEIGQTLTGPAIGEVIAAPGTDFTPGELVEHDLGWREYAVVDPAHVHRRDHTLFADPGAYLSQGATAWMGMTLGAEVRPGDTVFVSGAAGGVGSLAGQIARLRGATRVIGSTGSRAKADHLIQELGYDAAVIRGEGSIEEQLRQAAPDGIDAAFDNVGGEQLQAALAVARPGARFALIGALSGQLSATGGTRTTAVIDSMSLITSGITLRGLALYDHLELIPQWNEVFARGLRESTLTFPHFRVHGIEKAPGALAELLTGRHIGAVLVEF